MIELFVILVIIGFGSGILGSLIGVGGGIVMTPVLTYMGFSPAVIASSSLIAVFATSISSTITYIRKKYINYWLGLQLALPAIPGSIIGGFFSNFISLEYFKIYFAILLTAVGLYIFFKNKIINKTLDRTPKPLFYLILISGTFGAGIISSFFGIGGGIIFVPILVIIYKLKMINASPTAQFTLLISTITGLLTHIILEHPDYSYGIALAFGAFFGAQLGSRSIHLVNENILSKIFSFSLIMIAINLVIDYIKGLK
ncbi:MAG TPA: sulfite exporter TauE/SafE family protein [Nitrososphaeraceae archaeon]|nr:sulfite exporter TauE/SafE family protein [Nitrososphaeraceae archaeon]